MDPATRNITAQRNVTREERLAEIAHEASFYTAATRLWGEYFNETIAKGLWFVEYYATRGFISYTRDFHPIWSKLAEEIKERKIEVRLAKINCSVDKEFCDATGVDEYPQLRLYRDGEFVETFDQPRELDVMRSYLEDHARRSKGLKQTIFSVQEPSVKWSLH
ncbi:hypothetical protein NM688_g897 [Phlebia brevispora]|uniref:Uncharacterized protein n=1 Tax=Phlebia brevispora TaxID=194682 RepID=A0ACC1TD28_9APHY|nr:hypothetical protein NM688_g897 [Phlebia brevispora]